MYVHPNHRMCCCDARHRTSALLRRLPAGGLATHGRSNTHSQAFYEQVYRAVQNDDPMHSWPSQFMPEYYGELGNCINIQNLLEGCAAPPAALPAEQCDAGSSRALHATRPVPT